MILDKVKLSKDESPSQTMWIYAIDEIFKIYFRVIKDTIYVQKYKALEIEEQKEFKKDFDGFNSSTKYFEELIYASQNQNQNSDAENPQPPIGILRFLSGEKDYNIGIKMQDGRSTYVTLNDQIGIKHNQLSFNKTVLTDSEPFERLEKYYIDVIGKDPTVMGIYPFQDLVDKDFKVSKDVEEDQVKEILENKDPYNQKDQPEDGSGDDPTEKEEEKPDFPATMKLLEEEKIKRVLNDVFGADSYNVLLQTYGGLIGVLAEINNFTDKELTNFKTKLGKTELSNEMVFDYLRENLQNS
jgi:hypothetical protein